MRRIFLPALALACAVALSGAVRAASPAPARVYLPQLAAPGADPDLAALAEAAHGLLYLSEADAPLTPLTAPPEAGASPLAACDALAGDTPLRMLDPAAFLGAPARTEPWMTPEQLAAAARFAELRAVFLARLADPVACRVGDARADVYLLGVSSHGIVVGLRTLVVET